MGWRGIAFGALVGSFFGGPLGAILGAAVAHHVGRRLGGGPRGVRPGPSVSARGRAMVFCASAAAMLAKMAKADGVVTPEEIASVERAFATLGFDGGTRRYAIDVFRRAKDDSHTIYQYAEDVAVAMDSLEVRELFYELLWDLARADGRVSQDELDILRRIPAALRIRPAWFAFHWQGRRQTADDPIAEAYATLGVPSTASDESVRKAYRDLAKKHHPDVLRAQGLPEEMVGKATEKMGRINDAWKVVRERRGI